MQSFSLEEKTILVTGGSSGIGRATAKALSSYGAKIIAVARNKDRLDETMLQLDGSGHCYYSCDISSIGNIEPLFKQIIAEIGTFDGIAHCAGIGPSRPLKNTTVDFIQEVLDINFLAFAEMIRIFSLKKFHNSPSSVVGVSSIESKIGLPANEAYCASKGAMDSFINCAAKELYAKDIRVNTVLPGWVKTEMAEQYLSEISGGSEESMEKIEKAVSPEEVANVIAFLMSDLSSGVNGAHIPIMGKQW